MADGPLCVRPTKELPRAPCSHLAARLPRAFLYRVITILRVSVRPAAVSL